MLAISATSAPMARQARTSGVLDEQHVTILEPTVFAVCGGHVHAACSHKLMSFTLGKHAAISASPGPVLCTYLDHGLGCS